jgi:hypothetical protein
MLDGIYDRPCRKTVLLVSRETRTPLFHVKHRGRLRYNSELVKKS